MAHGCVSTHRVHTHTCRHAAVARSPPATSCRRCRPNAHHLCSTCAAPRMPLCSQCQRQASVAFFSSKKEPSAPHHHLCSPRHLPLPPLHPTPTPSSTQATPLSRSTVLKQHFCLEPTAVRSPRSYPMLCSIFAEGASPTAAISGHCSSPASPPRGPHWCPNPLWPTSQCQ
jgi:hypothetical protein